LGHESTNFIPNGALTCISGCTETGTCDRCGKEMIRVVYASDHDFADYVTKNEAACAVNGIKYANCSKCDAQDAEIIPAMSHKFTDFQADNNASCVTDGTESMQCTVCGFTRTRTIEDTALGTHSFTNYVYNQDATCVNYGTKTAKCDRCDMTNTIADLDNLAQHTEKSMDGQHKEPTCTESGITAGKECSVCGEILTGPEMIPASGHTEETVPGQGASCTEMGITEGKKCAVCDVILQAQESIPMIPHNWKNEVCTVCGTKSEDWQAVIRLAGGHRYETAFLAANRMKANLDIEKFDAVVVASGINFADALSGSYLAAVKNAPILLASGVDWVDALVKDYISANLNPGGTVYILGGTSAVPGAFETGLEAFVVNRLAGAKRFDTNLMVLAEAGVDNKDILVCTGLGFADSLSASAAQLPILLVWNNLTDGQKELLDNLEGNKLYVIGGESAVSSGMEEQLKAYGEVARVAGGNRFETSVAIAETFFDGPESAVLAYAWNFPDGLCGGPLAATMDAPLILTMDKFEAKAADYIRSRNIDTGIILGGTGLISEETVNKIFN
jgi:putative cell wall-binding protein